jgi:hypothetical protein
MIQALASWSAEHLLRERGVPAATTAPAPSPPSGW